MKSLSFLRLLALLVGGTFALTSSTCGSGDSAAPAPATAKAQTIELRYTVTDTNTNAQGNGPVANLEVRKLNAGRADSVLFDSDNAHPTNTVRIPDGSHVRTITRRFRAGESFVVKPIFVYAGSPSNVLRPTTNLHVEAWSGTVKLGETDLGYADRNNTALREASGPSYDLVRVVTVTVP